MVADGIICQGCGIEAPVKHVEFHQNIGMVVMRQSSSIKGNLCKKCVHSQFWQKTGTTLGVGWIGTISVIIAPVFIIMNLVQYLGALGMEAVPADARRPILDEPAVAALSPVANELLQRIGQGEQINGIAREIAPRIGLSPGQVILYIQWLANAARQQQALQQQRVYGFPVQPATGHVAPAPLPVIPIPAIPPQTASAPMAPPPLPPVAPRPPA